MNCQFFSARQQYVGEEVINAKFMVEYLAQLEAEKQMEEQKQYNEQMAGKCFDKELLDWFEAMEEQKLDDEVASYFEKPKDTGYSGPDYSDPISEFYSLSIYDKEDCNEKENIQQISNSTKISPETSKFSHQFAANSNEGTHMDYYLTDIDHTHYKYIKSAWHDDVFKAQIYDPNSDLFYWVKDNIHDKCDVNYRIAE